MLVDFPAAPVVVATSSHWTGTVVHAVLAVAAPIGLLSVGRRTCCHALVVSMSFRLCSLPIQSTCESRTPPLPSRVQATALVLLCPSVYRGPCADRVMCGRADPGELPTCVPLACVQGRIRHARLWYRQPRWQCVPRHGCWHRCRGGLTAAQRVTVRARAWAPCSRPSSSPLEFGRSLGASRASPRPRRQWIPRFSEEPRPRACAGWSAAGVMPARPAYAPYGASRLRQQLHPRWAAAMSLLMARPWVLQVRRPASTRRAGGLGNVRGVRAFRARPHKQPSAAAASPKGHSLPHLNRSAAAATAQP